MGAVRAAMVEMVRLICSHVKLCMVGLQRLEFRCLRLERFSSTVFLRMYLEASSLSETALKSEFVQGGVKEEWVTM